jgi:hypothetical protein
MKISRIRLSDKTSRLHPRHVVPKPAQALWWRTFWAFLHSLYAREAEWKLETFRDG